MHTSSGRFPYFSTLLLGSIIICCLMAELIMPYDPTYLDLANCTQAPCREFIFGTDSLGRDIFSMIWYGGRISLFIGLMATVISTTIAFIYGTFSGLAGQTADSLLMRLSEILLCIPSILVVVFIQAIIGQQNAAAIAFVIGITSWMSLAKVVRSEVRQLKDCEFVLVSHCFGGGFFHIMLRHLTPNVFPTVLFMIVMNISGAIVTESTLSFLGLGLPVEIVSWGNMLSLAPRALLTGAWWIIIIPGAFLVAVILCITNLANYLRRRNNPCFSNL